MKSEIAPYSNKVVIIIIIIIKYRGMMRRSSPDPTCPKTKRDTLSLFSSNFLYILSTQGVGNFIPSQLSSSACLSSSTVMRWAFFSLFTRLSAFVVAHLKHWSSSFAMLMSFFFPLSPSGNGIFDDPLKGLEAERRADRELGVGLGVKKRAYTEDKKNLLRDLNINVNKGDGPSARSLLERLKVTVNRKGRINGAELDGVRIIVQRGKKLVFTENLADSVLRSSLERLNEEISEKADGIAVELTENKLREFWGILAARLPTAEKQR